MGIFKERETIGRPPTSLWCMSQGQAGSCQDAYISTLKFTFCFPIQQSDMIFSIPIGHSYLGLWHSCRIPGVRDKAISGRRTRFDFRAFYSILSQHPPFADMLSPSALGKELNLSSTLLTSLGLPMPRDHDVHSANFMTSQSPSSSMPEWRQESLPRQLQEAQKEMV